MSKKLAATIFNCLIIFLMTTSFAFGQERESDLKNKRITIKVDKQPLGMVFRNLMENYNILIGFEQSILDRNHGEYAFESNLPATAEKTMESTDRRVKITLEVEQEFEAKLHPITVNIENGKLEDVFNQIVEQMENYKWEINDGVINIFPIKGRDKRFENFLGTNVKSFTFEKGKTVKDITSGIIRLPELYRFLKENQLNFNGTRTGAEIRLEAQYGRTIDAEMNFSNLTFRDLLNKITKIKKGGWILKWSGISPRTHGEYIDIDI